MAADVTRPADIARMVDEPYRRWGRLDVLFNNAGVIRVQPMLDVTEAEWDRVLDVNLRAVFFVLQAAARRMVDQPPMAGSELRGKLIQTASIAAYRGANPTVGPLRRLQGRRGEPHAHRRPGAGAPAHHLELHLPGRGGHRDVAADRSRAGRARRPGAGGGLEAPDLPGFRSAVPRRRTTWRGWSQFLAGPDSDYMTGQAINMDGGLVMGN